MSGLGIIFLIYILFKIFGGGSSDKSPVHANRVSLLTIYASFYSAFVIVGIFIFAFAKLPGLAIFAALILTPRLQANICIRNGWPKMAYYIGKFAFLSSVRDNHCRPLFWFYLAITNAPKEKQESLLSDLNLKLNIYKNIEPRKIQTGTLLLSCFLQNPGARDLDIARKLQCFGNSASKRIPSEIARHCFKFCLAAELNETKPSQWLDVAESVALRWHKVGISWSTGWILAKAAERRGNLKFFQRIILLLSIGRPLWAKKLFSMSIPLTSENQEMEKETDDIDLRLLYSKNIEDDSIVTLQHQLMKPEFEHRWYERAAQLGCFNPNFAIDEIRRSVDEFAGLNSANFRDQSDAVHEQVEQLQRQLRMHIHALSARPRKKKRFDSLSELDKWLNILLVLKQLDHFEPESKLSLYYQIRHECWNWMADLWNSGNHSLSYFICNTLHSLALLADDDDALKTFKQILNGKCS